MPVPAPSQAEITDDITRRTAIRRVLHAAKYNACAIVIIPEQPANVLWVEDGEEGYLVLATMHTPELAREYADKLNLKLNVSPALRDCLLAHSMFPGTKTTPSDYANAREYTARS